MQNGDEKNLRKASAIRFDWHDQRIFNFTGMLDVIQSLHPPQAGKLCLESGNQSRVMGHPFT
jgi:hypothetical protein